jgi:hypothetical protein
MCADCPTNLNVSQFKYDTPELGESRTVHRVRAFADSGAHVGDMLWDSKQIRNIGVPSDQQRRGIATQLWHEGNRLASENKKIPAPKHSADRTAAGDAWAKSVGGRLPRRLK